MVPCQPRGSASAAITKQARAGTGRRRTLLVYVVMLLLGHRRRAGSAAKAAAAAAAAAGAAVLRCPLPIQLLQARDLALGTGQCGGGGLLRAGRRGRLGLVARRAGRRAGGVDGERGVRSAREAVACQSGRRASGCAARAAPQAPPVWACLRLMTVGCGPLARAPVTHHACRPSHGTVLVKTTPRQKRPPDHLFQQLVCVRAAQRQRQRPRDRPRREQAHQQRRRPGAAAGSRRRRRAKRGLRGRAPGSISARQHQRQAASAPGSISARQRQQRASKRACCGRLCVDRRALRGAAWPAAVPSANHAARPPARPPGGPPAGRPLPAASARSRRRAPWARPWGARGWCPASRARPRGPRPRPRGRARRRCRARRQGARGGGALGLWWGAVGGSSTGGGRVWRERWRPPEEGTAGVHAHTAARGPGPPANAQPCRAASARAPAMAARAGSDSDDVPAAHAARGRRPGVVGTAGTLRTHCCGLEGAEIGPLRAVSACMSLVKA
jgi:hypothetical protein